MEFFGGPAALGGLIMCVTLGAWMLGRWQGGVAPDQDARDAVPVATPLPAVPCAQDHMFSAPAPVPVPASAIPCQQAAQAERRGVLEAAASLGDLHAEVSAYRRAEQVLAGLGRDQLDLVLIPTNAGQSCRYLGVSGQPTCPMPGGKRHTSACGKSCAGFDVSPQWVVQPSPASDFTRV